MPTCTYFRFQDFILGPETLSRLVPFARMLLSQFSLETSHDLWFPSHLTRKHSNTKTTVDITAELQFPLINVTSITQIPLLTGSVNTLNPELNPICYLLALLGAHHFLHVSRIRVKLLTLRLLMSYIYMYMEHPFLMFLDHTQRRSTVGRTPLDE